MNDELARLEQDWRGDLAIVVNEQVARVLAAHFVTDLRARYHVKLKQPKAKTTKPTG